MCLQVVKCEASAVVSSLVYQICWSIRLIIFLRTGFQLKEFPLCRNGTNVNQKVEKYCHRNGSCLVDCWKGLQIEGPSDLWSGLVSILFFISPSPSEAMRFFCLGVFSIYSSSI